VPKNEQSHHYVVQALAGAGWNDPKAAGYIANWLLGTDIKISSLNKIENYFKLG